MRRPKDHGFPGRVRVSQNGKYVSSRNNKFFYGANALLYVCTVLFYVFSVPYIWKHITPAVPIITSYLLVFCITSLYKTAFTDPGFVPRAPIPEEDTSMAPMLHEVVVNGVAIKVKWCDTCNYYRKPRSTHCSSCNACVENFDHHCPWVGNCVGRRNYPSFFAFILTLSLYIALVLAFVIYKIVLKFRNEHQTVEQLFKNQWPDMVVGAVCALTLLPVSGLTYFHMRLIRSNKTTNEAITGKVRRGQNPYNRGLWGNINERLCGPRTPSFILEREFHRSNQHEEIAMMHFNPRKPSPEQQV